MKNITAREAAIMFPAAMRAAFETDTLLAVIQGKRAPEYDEWLSRQESEQHFVECDGELRTNYVNSPPDEWEFWSDNDWCLLYA